jgi:hypothetical protein
MWRGRRDWLNRCPLMTIGIAGRGIGWLADA